MLKNSTRTPWGRVLGLSLLAALALPAVPAAADETFVVEADTITGTGALLRVDAISGNRSVVSDFSNPAQGPLGNTPRGLALEASGAVLVTDVDAGTSNRGALFRVDAISGSRSLVSDFGDVAEGPLGVNPRGLTVEAGGTVLVVDPTAATLFRVDARSGDRSLVSDFGSAAQGPLGVSPVGLALEAGGAVLVIDGGAGRSNLGALFRVDAISGRRTLVSDFGNPRQGPLGVTPRALALDADGTVLVIDPSAGANGRGLLFRVDAINGNRSLVSGFGNPAQGLQGSNPTGLALEASGRVLVIDPDAGTGNAGVLFRIDRLSGQRRVLSDFGNSGQGQIGLPPVGVAVVVPNCLGQVPTLVGDNGNNVLIGSPRADVILGRAGDDLLDGQGGEDRICGSEGNDALRGGSGNDRAAGGAGDDLIEGGNGTDRCTNGEALLSCER